MATKLTPDMLRRIVLEEKKKIEAASAKSDKKARAAMELDETEHDFSKAHKPMSGHKHVTKGPGTTDGWKELKEQEERLLAKLQSIKEQKFALRKKILSELS